MRFKINNKALVCPECLNIPLPLLRPLQLIDRTTLQCPHCLAKYKEKKDVEREGYCTVTPRT